MLKTGWMRLMLAGAGVFLAFAVVACSDDDNGDREPAGATDASPTVAGEATDTSGGQAAPIDTPADGSSGSTGAGPSSAPPIPDFEQPPATTASANGATVEMGIGTYCWTVMCVDKIGVPTKGTLTVNRGDTVSIAVPSDAPALREAGATVFEATQAQPLDDGSEIWPYPGNPGEDIEVEVVGDTVEVTADLAPGRYVLSLGMYFETGDVIYGVLLEVQ